MSLPRLAALAVLSLPFALHAQSTVFNDSFTGDSLDPATYPSVTATTTGWDVASSKTAPAPTDSSGLQINMVSTSSGFIEAQALFTSTPVRLIAGTNIQLTGVFTPTNVLVHASDTLSVGLYNSGGSAPISGLIASGLSSASTNFASGGAKGWQGYDAYIAFTAGTSKMVTRPVQTGTTIPTTDNNTNQDVVVGAQSSSAGYGNPAGTGTGSSTSAVAALTNGATYTLAYNLALSASGTTLTATYSIYNGVGTTGTGSNTLVASYTGTMSGATLLSPISFDAMAVGWRADASLASDLNFSSLVVSTTSGPPTIATEPPANTSLSVGANLTLTAAVSGAASYQWQFSTDGGVTYSPLSVSANPTAGTASLTIDNVQPANAGTYQLVATNAAGTVTSTPAVVAVSTAAVPPAITTQPVSASAPQGGTASFTVAASGVPPPTYLWSLNGTALTDGAQPDGSLVSNSATATLTISGVMPDENGAALTATATNTAGSATSSAAILTVLAPLPTITTQTSPAGQTVANGSSVSFTAAASGATGYQWLFNGSPITGNPSAQTTTLTLGALTPLNAGTYALAAINAGGETISTPAILNVTAAAGAPVLPVIPDGDFNVTAYGAVADGVTDNTAAIQSAIAAAVAAGGGTVEIPPAAKNYLSGPITLGSSISLQVDAGATLQALPYGTYPDASNNPAVFVSWKNASNVQIVGGGTIDGNGTGWWNAFNTSGVSRPDLVKFSNCTAVLVAGVTLSNSPIEHLVPDGCTNVTIDGMTVATAASSPNTDGIDPSGTNILIENCSIADGDDNIAVKPENTLCSNITITGCAFGAGHGLSVGGQTNAGLNGMTVTNCTFNGTLTGLRLKADATEGGPVQNLSYSNITMTNVPSPIVFYSYYNQVGTPGATSGSNETTVAKVNSYNTTPPNSLAVSTLPTWQNISISNVTATGASQYSIIWGLPLANGLFSAVTLNNVNISGGTGFEIYNATNVQVTGSSSLGTLITDNALAITGQPQNQTASAGGTAVFSAAAVGASGVTGMAPTYLWSLNGTALTDGVQADGSVVTGSATATLTLSNVKVTDAGSYAVTVSNNLDGYNVTANALSANSLPVTATSSAATLVVQPSAVTVTLSNLSQIYTGLPVVPTVTTNPAGAVIALTYNGSSTAPTTVGSYAVVATVNDPNYTGGGATGTLTIAPATPILSWSAPAPVTFGTPLGAAQLDATSNVAGSFAYAPAAGTVLPGGANQALSATFTPADAADYTSGGTVGTTITVNSAAATVTLGALSQTFGGGIEDASAATNPPGLAILWSYNGLPLAFAPSGDTLAAYSAAVSQTLYVNVTGASGGTVTGSNPAFGIASDLGTAAVQAGILTVGESAVLQVKISADGSTYAIVGIATSGFTAGPVTVGTYTVTGTVVSPDYTGTGTGVLTIFPATPVITWTAPAGIVYGTALGAAQLDATASVAGTFTYTPAAGTVLSPGAGQALNASFAPTDSVDYATATASTTISVSQAPATITLSNTNQTYSGSPEAVGVTTSPAGLAVAVTYNGGATAPTAAGSYAVVATVTGPNYTGSASGTLTIGQATPVLAWAAPAPIAYGTPLGAAQLAATSNVAGSFSYAPAAGTILGTGVNQPLSAAFTPADAADYASGITVGTTITVNPGAATVTLGNLGQAYTGAAHAVSVATVPAGLATAVTYNGSATAPTAAGSYAVVATVVDPNYTGSAAGTLVIAKATPALAWAAPAPITAGTPLGANQLDASANVAGGFVYAPPAGTVLAVGANQPLSATFTPADLVDYTAGGTVGTTITVNPGVATVTLGNLSQVYSGSAKSVTVTTTPSGLATTVTYNGSATAPIAAGSYAVVATVTASNYTGSATGTLVIAKAAPVLSWTAPAPINAGTALSATQLDATSSVAGGFAYTPAAGAVLAAGTQTLTALFTPSDAVDYASGSISTTITVKQATATIVLSGLDQDYTGQPLSVTATTNPAGLAVTITYNGSATAPTYPGTYAVVATITNPSYTGTISASMVIMTTGLVSQAPVLNGNAAFEGSIQMLSPDSVNMSGNAYISGDLLVPGTPTLQTSGNAKVAGTINAGGTATPTNYQVSLSGNALLRDLVRQVNPVAMPTVAAPPASNQNVTLNGNAPPTTLAAGNYGTVIVNGNTTLIVGTAGATTPTVYNIQNLTLNGNGVLEVVGPVTITVGNGVTLNGNSGASAHAEWLVLAVANGGVTLNGGVTFNGSIIAPAGQVIVNGNSTLNGTVMANSLLLNGGAIVDPNGL